MTSTSDPVIHVVIIVTIDSAKAIDLRLLSLRISALTAATLLKLELSRSMQRSICVQHPKGRVPFRPHLNPPILSYHANMHLLFNNLLPKMSYSYLLIQLSFP